MTRSRLCFLTLFFWFWAPVALAEEVDRPESPDYSIGFVVENDVFADTDHNYTNGVRLVFTSPFVEDGDAYGWDRFVADRMLGRGSGDFYRREFAIGQSIFTPDDGEATEPLPGQHPYAGWFYGEVSAQVLRPARRMLDTATLQIGIVGPSAGGEFVQNNFHELIDVGEFKGWDNQLKDEPGFVLSFDRKHSLPIESFGSNGRFGADFIPSYGFSVGNVLTQANIGAVLRLGYDLDRTFGPSRIRPALGGSTFFSTRSPLSGFVFVGVEGRAVAQNIFLDGNTWQDSLSVDKRPFVGDLQGGFVLQYSNWQLAWTMVARTKEFETQRGQQRFGAVSLTRRF